MGHIMKALKHPIALLAIGALVGVVIDHKTGLVTKVVQKISFGRLP